MAAILKKRMWQPYLPQSDQSEDFQLCRVKPKQRNRLLDVTLSALMFQLTVQTEPSPESSIEGLYVWVGGVDILQIDKNSRD